MVIYWSINCKRPDLIDILPVKYEIEKLSRLWKPREFSLKGALENAFGGEDFVLTNVKSKLGYVIDHVIQFSKDGIPISFKKNEEYIEEIDSGKNHL